MEGAIQTKRHRNASENEQNGEDEGIELNLGLSMNGRFGVDPLRKKLKRSSTVSNLVFTVGGGGDDTNHARGVAFESYAPLLRTRSLPTETEEEWRRRKELESMRRMEARKKRMEKLKSVSVGVQKVVSQGSIGSSSGSSDLENHQTEGPKQNSVVISPSNGLPQDQREQEPAIRAADVDRKGRNESLTSAMMDMPHVTTREDGPNGHKIEGFLYRYKKGEEVKIVCVCHGMFLSPAEFVKHGGGGDVEQPLKHIVVNPFPIS